MKLMEDEAELINQRHCVQPFEAVGSQVSSAAGLLGPKLVKHSHQESRGRAVFVLCVCVIVVSHSSVLAHFVSKVFVGL